MSWKANVTVAAVIEHDERYLCIEEMAGGQRVVNQPAGHLEPGESLLEAACREVLEETGATFRPEGVVGVYLYHSEREDKTFLRICFSGTCAEVPGGADPEILGVTWLTREELAARRAAHRSPLVLRCVDDYRAGARYPLALVEHGTG